MDECYKCGRNNSERNGVPGLEFVENKHAIMYGKALYWFDTYLCFECDDAEQAKQQPVKNSELRLFVED